MYINAYYSTTHWCAIFVHRFAYNCHCQMSFDVGREWDDCSPPEGRNKTLLQSQVIHKYISKADNPVVRIHGQRHRKQNQLFLPRRSPYTPRRQRHWQLFLNIIRTRTTASDLGFRYRFKRDDHTDGDGALSIADCLTNRVRGVTMTFRYRLRSIVLKRRPDSQR